MQTYAEHIKHVFITPIRSVLVIDDQFPTLDSLLTNGPEIGATNKELLAKLLHFCRAEERQWLVDVHDGKGLEEHALPCSSLKQCDWLILDYKLDGDAGDGGKAISILRELAGGQNFNLVVVYTSQDIGDVYAEITVALSSELRAFATLTEAETTEVDNKIEEWSDTDPEIEAKLRKMINPNLCAELNLKSPIQNPANHGLLSDFMLKLSDSAFDDVRLKQLLLQRLVCKLLSEKTYSSARAFELKTPQAGSANRWVLAENVFVAIINKEVAPNELLQAVSEAIADWGPSPNRLIFTKLRTELDASGLGPERELFRDRELQAFWLEKLLATAELERRHYIGALLDRQTEDLVDVMRSKVTEFAEEVVKTALADSNTPISVANHFWKVDLTKEGSQKKGRVAHNTRVSTKNICGKNLVPGHVLKINADITQYWVCLSPACDLVAGRVESGREFKQRIHPWMPFTAVKLHGVSEAVALKNASRGWVIFLSIGGNMQQFSIFKNADSLISPEWEEFLAGNEGRLQANLELNVASLGKPGNETTAPNFQMCSATVVAQLRSEYAANLTLRLTNHLARIGLDYD